MNTVEVCITPKLLDCYSVANKIVVVVDILRATTMITTMFGNGLAKLIPVKSLDEAREYKKAGYLVAAERNGKKVDFADFGNSPFEFTSDKIKSKTLVYNSTNGTQAIHLAAESGQVVIASFLNISSVANYLIKQNKNLIILCSGWKGDFCTEDVLFAGALSAKLLKSGNFSFNSDSVKASVDLWNLADKNLSDYIKTVHQYKRLIKFGFKEIIEYCFKSDLTEVIPALKEKYIIDIK